jgi:hypothetical protein
MCFTFGIDNYAHRNRHESGTDRGGLNSLQQVLWHRLIRDAIRGRRAGISLVGQRQFVHARRHVREQLRTICRQIEAHPMTAALGSECGAIEPNTTEIHAIKADDP